VVYRTKTKGVFFTKVNGDRDLDRILTIFINVYWSGVFELLRKRQRLGLPSARGRKTIKERK